jgi:hypothetical protein
MLSQATSASHIIGNTIRRLKCHVEIKNQQISVENCHSRNDIGNNAKYQNFKSNASMKTYFIKNYSNI